MRTLEAEDQLAIHQLLSLYGHIIDEREYSRSHELFTDDVRYDVSDFDAGVHVGIDAIVALWRASDRHPLAHHATNVVITVTADCTVQVTSKGLGVLADGRTGSVVYRDIVVETGQGWRIRQRIAWRRRPDRIPAPG
jgi:SnoaL-like domain